MSSQIVAPFEPDVQGGPTLPPSPQQLGKTDATDSVEVLEIREISVSETGKRVEKEIGPLLSGSVPEILLPGKKHSVRGTRKEMGQKIACADL